MSAVIYTTLVIVSGLVGAMLTASASVLWAWTPLATVLAGAVIGGTAVLLVTWHALDSLPYTVGDDDD